MHNVLMYILFTASGTLSLRTGHLSVSSKTSHLSQKVVDAKMTELVDVGPKTVHDPESQANLKAWMLDIRAESEECSSDPNTLAGDLMNMAWKSYVVDENEFMGRKDSPDDYNNDDSMTDTNANERDAKMKEVKAFDANFIKCWMITYARGSARPHDAEQPIDVAVPGFLRVWNKDRCVMVDVFEGTRTKRSRLNWMTGDRFWETGKAVSPLSQVKMRNATTGSFLLDYCGNPEVSQAVAKSFSDFISDDFMDELKLMAAYLGKVHTLAAEPIFPALTAGGKCPNGWTQVTAGYSLGGSLAMLAAYCKNHYYYRIWQQDYAQGTDWPAWAKMAYFYEAVYEYGAPTSGNGNLFDFGSLVIGKPWTPRAATRTGFVYNRYASTNVPMLYTWNYATGGKFCWSGGRFIFAGRYLDDPFVNMACRQVNDVLDMVELSDDPGQARKTACNCPGGIHAGRPADTIVAAWKAFPCTAYKRAPDKCLECQSPTLHPAKKTHSNVALHECYIRASTQEQTETQLTACRGLGKLQQKVTKHYQKAWMAKRDAWRGKREGKYPSLPGCEGVPAVPQSPESFLEQSSTWSLDDVVPTTKYNETGAMACWIDKNWCRVSEGPIIPTR